MTTSADSGESRRTAMRTQTGLLPSTEQHQEQLPCPRCDSANTKFCYYNNYNFSQPRHFCKSCRRYWTHGGTLRDVPVGGGTRRAAKRSRTYSPSSSGAGTLDAPLQATPVLFPQTTSTLSNGAVTVNDGKGGSLSLSGSFTSLLSQNGDVVTAATTHGTSGFDDVSFGLERGAAWPFSSTATTNVASNAVSVVPATWQFEGLESSNVGGFVPGEYFAWPDLYVTAPVSSLK